MTPFAEELIEAIAKRLSLQQGHGLPVAPGYREYADEFVSDIRPIVNAEVSRILGEFVLYTDHIAALEAVKATVSEGKVIKRRTMVELLSAVYEHHGWRRVEGESRSKRVQSLYAITADAPNNMFIATPRSLVPSPALEAKTTEQWCQPRYEGKDHPRKFMVVYEDAEMGNAVFEDEAEARDHFERASVAWNCYLFGLLPTSPALEVNRPCTCHPDDNPPEPCARKYAYSECVAAALEANQQEVANLREILRRTENEALGYQQVIETLRAALKPFATDADIYDGQSIIDGEKSFLNDNLTVGDLRRARAALASTQNIGGAS